MRWIRPPKGNYYVASLNLTTLDSIVRQPVDVIKIDVEGNEMLVAKGSERLFGRHQARLPHFITSEFAPTWIHAKDNATDPLDYVRYFTQRGYTVTDTHGGHAGCTAEDQQRWLAECWKRHKFHGQLIMQLEMRHTKGCLDLIRP